MRGVFGDLKTCLAGVVSSETFKPLETTCSSLRSISVMETALGDCDTEELSLDCGSDVEIGVDAVSREGLLGDLSGLVGGGDGGITFTTRTGVKILQR